MKVAIYARLSQSTTEGESESITNQVAALRKLADREGHEVVREFVDDGVSGYKKVDRPGFESMLAALAHGEFERILTRHFDRLSRNDQDAARVRTACAAKGATWQVLDGTVTDPGSASGGLIAKITSAISQNESQIKSERLRMSFGARTARGETLAPRGTLGYDDADRTKVVPWEADLIRQAYEAVAAGRSVGSIVREWNEKGIPQRKGGKRWVYPTVKGILKRHRNAGVVVDRDGQVLDGVVGKWEAIVTPELFYRVQLILNDPSRNTGPGYQPVYLTSAIAVCGVCGEVMRSRTASDKVRGRRRILQCTALDKGGVPHASARLEVLDPLVRAAVIDAFAFGPAGLFGDPAVSDVQRLLEALSALQARRDDYFDLFNGGMIAKAELASQLGKLKADEQPLREGIEKARAASASANMLVDLRAQVYSEGRASISGAADLKAELGQRFDSLHIEQKRRLVAELLSITVHPGKGLNKYEVIHTVVTGLNEGPAD